MLVITDCSRPSHTCVNEINKLILNYSYYKTGLTKVRLREPTRPIFPEVEHAKRELVLSL